MKELQFVAAREASWGLWDRWLGLDETASAAARKKIKRDPKAIEPRELPARYRALCHDLSLARDRNYSASLVERLQARVLLAHQFLYGARSGVGRAVFDFLLFGLPVATRREWRVVAAAALIFFVPLIVVSCVVHESPDTVYLFMSQAQVQLFEQMYGRDHAHLANFTGTVNWMRYTGYIAHNMTIDFQCFATGLAFCIGTVAYVVYNAFDFGAVAGYLTQRGLDDNFWGFVCGHSAFELTGIVLSGAAGLKLGMALVAPGRRTRGTALVENARSIAPLIFGAALLTFMAASIEAFWSPLASVPLGFKYGFGVFMWVAVWSYLLLARPSGARARGHGR